MTTLMTWPEMSRLADSGMELTAVLGVRNAKMHSQPVMHAKKNDD
jgi:hypothetical protein